MLLSLFAALAAQGQAPPAAPPGRRVDFYCKAIPVDGAAFAFSGRQAGGVVTLADVAGTPLEGFHYLQIGNGQPGTLMFYGRVKNEHHMVHIDLDPWSSQTPTVKITRSGWLHDSRTPTSVATGFCAVRVNGKEDMGAKARVRRP
ncbi:MAG TPA: hypothetical protein VF718_06475 [Allosphingosinicella sp.]|jgi:hypothetical protein